MRVRTALVVAAITATAVALPVFLPASNAASYPNRSQIGPPPVTAEAISLFQRRVDDNPNPIDLTLLAQLQLRRSRETGDITELTRAEAALSEALEDQPRYAPAVAMLASVLFAEHRFEEALGKARAAHELNPRLGSIALVGDVLAATGDYQGAKTAYQEAGRLLASPGLTTRLAHIEELEGRPDEAIRLMEQAAAADLAAGGVGEQAAWFQVRLGDLNFNAGHLREAQRRYQAALDIFPGYWSALAGAGKVAAARGDYRSAIDLYERAGAVVPRPEVMVALGDLYSITGEEGKAADRYATVEAIARLGGGVYDRTLALFYADHGRPDEALALAEAGIEVRRDIYGYDTLGWSLYRLGRFEEAEWAMEKALALGTRDSQLLFHAGAVSLALGKLTLASQQLSAAVELNPHFHPRLAEQAEQLLKAARP